MDELIQEFLVESNENLDRFDSDLVKLEADPQSHELLSSIFRGIHSNKGTCGFRGFHIRLPAADAGLSIAGSRPHRPTMGKNPADCRNRWQCAWPVPAPGPRRQAD